MGCISMSEMRIGEMVLSVIEWWRERTYRRLMERSSRKLCTFGSSIKLGTQRVGYT